MKKETKITIVYDEDSNTTAYLNNPDADIEAHVMMLTIHIILATRRFISNGLSIEEAVTRIKNAMVTAIDTVSTENVIRNAMRKKKKRTAPEK